MHQLGILSSRLKRRYVYGIALAFGAVVFAFTTVMYLPQPIAERLVRDDVANQAETWKLRILGLVTGGKDSFARGVIADEDKDRLEQFTRASDVFRFKMFTAEGKVFWSSREPDRGTITKKPYYFNVVAAGKIYYKQANKPITEIDNFIHQEKLGVIGPDASRQVAEIYVPILLEGRFVGAVEFYRDITDIQSVFFQRVRFALAVFSAVFVALFFGTIGTVFISGERRLRQVRLWAEHEQQIRDEQVQLSREVKLLSELGEWLQSSRSLEELFDMVGMFMRHLLPDCAGSVYVYSNSRDVLDGACSWNGEEHQDHIRPESCWSLRRGRTYAYGQSEISFACEHVEPHDGGPYLCLPILAHGETVGLMSIRPTGDVAASDFWQSRKLAQMAAEQISLAIANAKMRDQLHDQSIRDPLTGLFNRRHFIEALRNQIESSIRSGAAFSLLSVDVDHFKKFNDNHGHDAGDMVLRAVGTVLEKSCDRDELPCRIGGEEFMVLLPSCDEGSAAERAENLRSAIEAISVRYGDKSLPRITISVGIACYPEHGAMPQDLMKSADDALYEAKAKGRNQVCIAGAHHEGRSAEQVHNRPAA